MKKILMITVLILCVLMMSGCGVHWFDHYYDVPWYVIAIPTVMIFIIAHIYIMSGIYICPKCKEGGMCRDETIVLTSIPPKHMYECNKCHHVEYHSI